MNTKTNGKRAKNIFGNHEYFSIEYIHPFLFGCKSAEVFISKLVNIQ
jgi:fido (protein-threonine AMPylation protein)